MISNKSISIRSEIMEMLKIKFQKSSFWKKIESDIALKCSELPEPDDKEKKKDFIKKLKSLKQFLSKQNIEDKELEFIDEEIELHKNAKIISLYEEKDDALDPLIIAGYSRLGKNTEGIVAIPQDYNYTQLSKLSNGVYSKTGLVKFYISKERKIYGKLLGEIYEHSQKIPIAFVVQSKKIDKESGEPSFKGIKLFGEKFSRGEMNIIKEINIPFYVYRFICENNNEYILLTTEHYEMGDYWVSGVQTQCDDYKMLTDSTKLATKLPFFFAQKLKSRIIKFKDNDELKKKLDNLGITKDNFFDYPFSITKGDKSWKMLHPHWYKWLLWSWITHEKKGLMNSYPLHLMIIGEPGSGKSFLINSLFEKSKETRKIFSGSGSTLKSLVPSFKYNPAKLGYLAESNRFSFCDEFLRCMINIKTTKKGSERDESVAIMNDLLEHQKREVGSGIARVNVNMTSRIIATTNPINGIKSVDDLIDSYDASFLSRWLIYYQTNNHLKLVRESNDVDLEEFKFKIDLSDWISIIDYLQTFSSKYDLKEIFKIYKAVPKVLSENLNKHYDTRHKHHLECLIDGIIKTRCLLERDMSFKAKEEDYNILKEIWLKIIKSWTHINNLKLININERVNYLPEKSQYLYWKICEKKRVLDRLEVKEIALKNMNKMEFYEAFNLLIDNELIKEFSGKIEVNSYSK